jgi:hypothetical protein
MCISSVHLGMLRPLHTIPISVADPDPLPFNPWIRDPGWVKNQDPDPG